MDISGWLAPPTPISLPPSSSTRARPPATGPLVAAIWCAAEGHRTGADSGSHREGCLRCAFGARCAICGAPSQSGQSKRLAGRLALHAARFFPAGWASWVFPVGGRGSARAVQLRPSRSITVRSPSRFTSVRSPSRFASPVGPYDPKRGWAERLPNGAEPNGSPGGSPSTLRDSSRLEGEAPPEPVRIPSRAIRTEGRLG